ncbi:MAG: Site-specific recombinase, phage integrase family [Microgenomates group bacterium Gr01-1014_7]|nr:MAG: Site-specific recombinase, phage integrase family [Microgenomates group bacterium Gr01-1014_7]
MSTLSDAHKQFIDNLKAKSRASATILAYGKDIAQLIEYLEKMGKSDPNTVETTDLQAFMDDLAKNSYTAKSISRKTNSTKTFFKFLKTSGLASNDPATSLSHPKFENKPPRILTKLEYRALRDAARADTRMIAVIELLLQSGIRIGELAKLRVEDINHVEETLHVPLFEDTRERTMPLNKPAAETVAKYLEIRPKSPSHSLFITKTGRPLLIRNIRTAIDRYFRLAGIKQAKVNDLRHTWVAHQLQSGVPMTMVSKLAGHKRLTTTERYLQFIQGTNNGSAKVKLEEL